MSSIKDKMQKYMDKGMGLKEAYYQVKKDSKNPNRFRHEHGKPCPITGKPIPNEFIHTDRRRGGTLNACKACLPNGPGSPGEALTRLDEKRRGEEEASK